MLTLAAVAALILLLPLCVLVHEAGHALALRAMGRQVHVMLWMPDSGDAVMTHTRGTLRMSVGADLLSGRSACESDAMPTAPLASLAASLAGPFANLAACAALIPLLTLGQLVGGLLVVNALLGLGNLVPFRSRGRDSDGLHAVRALVALIRRRQVQA